MLESPVINKSEVSWENTSIFRAFKPYFGLRISSFFKYYSFVSNKKEKKMII